MIEDYIVQDTLGEGSFGVVVLAKHIQTAKKVAIKITTESEATREYEILTKLHHPNIIHAIEIIHIPITARPKLEYSKGLVMDYVVGGDLLEYITKNGQLSEKTALKFLVQIISALNHCHKRRIAHRDIKPDNILIDQTTGNLILCDFGLATICPPHRPLHGREGSLLYCAPEILKDVPYYGPQVDMWSAGVVFYCMLSGCIPWDGFDFREQMRNAMFAHWHKLPQVSKESQQFLSWMLSVDPTARPSASHLLKAILYHLEKDGDSVTPNGSDNAVITAVSSGEDSTADSGELREEQTTTESNPHQQQLPLPAIFHRSFHFREAKYAEFNHAVLYHIMYEEPEHLCTLLEHSLESLHINFSIKQRKKTWFHSPCFKYQCKNGQSRFDIEICVPPHTHSDTKVILCRKIKGDQENAMELLNQLDNKLSLM